MGSLKRRDDLPRFFREKGYEIGTEIGVYKGSFTEKFCKEGLKMYAVDPWKAFSGQGRTQQDQRRQDFLYEHACRALERYDCEIIREESMKAVGRFEDGSLDFVYIDGDHTLLSALQDITEWSKKVRKGGAVAGHDYILTPPHARNIIIQVQVAVDAYCKVNGITPYIFGKTDETKDDKTPSWLWIKE